MDTISNFWRSHSDYWFPVTAEQKATADAAITAQFKGYDYTKESFVGQVIYLDQFSRHFDRTADLTEQRTQAAAIVKQNAKHLLFLDEFELVFALMPFKHLGEYSYIFQTIHATLYESRSLTDSPLLNRFYNDTYKKAYSYEAVKANIKVAHPSPHSYDPAAICDSYPPAYNHTWTPTTIKTPLTTMLDPQPDIISLSGGVDSMVMLALAKPAVVVHIIYGNRQESAQEYAFLATYCERLKIPLITYSIEWLRRDSADREFYERMTRDIRFYVYRAAGELIGKPTPRVALGHIQDDVVENVWTNLAKAQHLSNLKKMERSEIQCGVELYRPLLTAQKSEIYKVATELSIPYLKNTTPAWSNRGKFRSAFHAATLAQFGPATDTKILEVADAYTEQSRLIHDLLYAPILESGADSGVYDITSAIKVGMGVAGWSYILEAVCHARGKHRPGIHAIQDFVKRLPKLTATSTKIPLKRDVTIIVNYVGIHWSFQII